jgi:hypothetical protein
MKKFIITLGALALCAAAQAQYRTLTTMDGETFTGISYQRIEPDGVYIEYTLPRGGIGMSKVKCGRLPRALQKQYGFTVTAARDYEAAVAQANQDAAQDLIHRYEAERDAQRQRDAENERAYGRRMSEIWNLNVAQAAAFYRTTKSSGWTPNSTSFQNSYGASFTSGPISTQTTYSSVSSDLSAGHQQMTSIRGR